MEPRLDMRNNALTGRVVKHLVSANAAVDGVVPTLTMELVKTRASQLNGCAFCLDMHTKEAVQAGETPTRLHLVAAWREAKGFSAAERAALALAEQGTRIGADGVGDDVWDRAAGHYDEDQLAALVAQIAVINAFNRLCVITRQPGGDHQARPAA